MKRHYSDKLKTTKQTLTTSKHSTEFTYSYFPNFPCHFKENRDKLALTNRGWMCKKGKRVDDYRKLSRAKFRQRAGRGKKSGPWAVS